MNRSDLIDQREIDKFGMSERQLQRAFADSHLGFRYCFLAPNIQSHWNDGNEFDLLAIRKSGFADEIEIKLSRADFRADFNKTCRHQWNKHKALENGDLVVNYFSFLVPESLRESIEDLVPDHAGLYASCGHGVTEVKKAPLLHRERRINENLRIRLGEKMMYRYWRLHK